MDTLSYSLDLSTVFEDLNGDPLTYKYRPSTESEWTDMDGSMFNYTFTGKDASFEFTANDGQGDGVVYKVNITGSLLGYIRVGEAIAADDSAYWTRDDFYFSPTRYLVSTYSSSIETPSEANSYYHRMLEYLERAKSVYEQYGDYISTGFHPANTARDNLKDCLNTLLTKDKLNVSRLWLAVTDGEKRLAQIDQYTEQTTPGPCRGGRRRQGSLYGHPLSDVL